MRTRVVFRPIVRGVDFGGFNQQSLWYIDVGSGGENNGWGKGRGIGASNLAQPLFSIIGPKKENSIFAKLIIGQKSNYYIITRITLFEDPLYLENPILKIFDSKYTD